jgi:4-hydroxybenzoate polyprenyltransferase
VALLASCHPAPCVAVTVYAGVLGDIAGNSTGVWLLFAAAVLAGQLSIGWSNDRIDSARDAALGRSDKPAANGRVAPRLLDGAIAVSLLATVALSLALGWRAGLLHLAAVACGWSYNLGLKSTIWSWAPYALAFGALPAVATLALPSPRWPAGWVLVAAAGIGVAAHLANTLPDLGGDLQTGVRGFPHRIGARAAVLVAAALLVGTTALIVLAAPSVGAYVVGAIVAGIVLTAAPVLVRAGRPTSAAFYSIMVLAAVDVVLLARSGTQLR